MLTPIHTASYKENNEVVFFGEHLLPELIFTLHEAYPECHFIFQQCIISGDYSRFIFENYSFDNCLIQTADMSQCVFKNTDSYNTTWKDVDMENTIFDNYMSTEDDFIHAKMANTLFMNVEIMFARFDTCNFFHATINENSSLRSCRSYRTYFDQTKIQNTDLTNSTFADCSMRNVRILDCDLRGTNWEIDKKQKKDISIQNSNCRRSNNCPRTPLASRIGHHPMVGPTGIAVGLISIIIALIQ